MSKVFRNKRFLECMFADLNDLSEGSDEEVGAELLEMGVDIEKAAVSLRATIEEGRRIHQYNVSYRTEYVDGKWCWVRDRSDHNAGTKGLV